MVDLATHDSFLSSFVNFFSTLTFLVQVHSSFCVICKKILVFVIICLLCTTVFMGRWR